MDKNFMKTMRENLMKEITELSVSSLNPYENGTVNFIDAVECTTFQNSYEEVSIYGLYVSHGEENEIEISVMVEDDEYPIERMNTDDLVAICDELKIGKLEVIGDGEATPVPTKLYVVYDNTVIDGDASCTECIGIFTTLEKARTALKNRAETYTEDEERWSEYGDVDEWTKTEDKYEIWEGSDYIMNHICITTEEANIDDKLFLNK
jgi:hypothetical protein